MSSGNPMGLSEISHFGTFQRVGGKAGGFISKKFFHPSSFRNQEKLWKAQNADERETRKQNELEKRRDEERQVEALKKQMYLAGQGKATDFLPSSSAPEGEAAETQSPEERKKSEQKLAIEEEQRRRALIKQQSKGDRKTVGQSSSVGKLAASRYAEDVYVLGHQTVWGSWYSTEEKRWGFACCKGMERSIECPLGTGDGATGSGAAEDDSSAAAAAPAAVASSQPEGGLRLPGRKDKSRTSGKDDVPGEADRGGGGGPLIDTRLLKEGERKSHKRKLESEQKEDTKTSDYLADLLQDPTSAGR